jgi:hypothetical protein
MHISPESARLSRRGNADPSPVRATSGVRYSHRATNALSGVKCSCRATNSLSSLRTQGPITTGLSLWHEPWDGFFFPLTNITRYGSLRAQGRHCVCLSRCAHALVRSQGRQSRLLFEIRAYPDAHSGTLRRSSQRPDTSARRGGSAPGREQVTAAHVAANDSARRNSFPLMPASLSFPIRPSA